jgi:hypothetical protein
MDGKIEQCVCITFCMKFIKSITGTFEMLHEAVGEQCLSWTAVFNIIHVSRPVDCQLKMTNVQDSQAPAKRQNILKKSENSFTYLFLLTLWSTLTFTVTFWVAGVKIQGIKTSHNWLFHQNNAPSHTSLKTTEFVTNNNMITISRPPYLAWKWNGRDGVLKVSDIQRQSQVVLKSIKANDFHGGFEGWKKLWDSCIRSQRDYFDEDDNQN